MSFFKKFTKTIQKSIDFAKDKLEDSVLGLSSKYPDIDDVWDVLGKMRERYNESVSQEDVTDADDNKWRPMILTLGLLYKIQKIDDHKWYQHDYLFLRDRDREEILLNTFGYFWHHFMNVAKCLRNSEHADGEVNEAGLKDHESVVHDLMSALTVPEEDVVIAHSSDSLHVDDHCPDFAIVVDHSIKTIIFTICGTRMMPCPNMKDVFMDLYADSEPFLHGKGHRGMVIGTQNIMEKCFKLLKAALESNEGYAVVVIGYSLGAGICQLVTMELTEGEYASSIPEGTVVKCISYGAPPVFISDNDGYKSPHIFTCIFANDGLVSASIANITKLFMQIKAIERLGMRRRDMFKLLWKGTSNGAEDPEEDADIDFDHDRDEAENKANIEDADQWDKIRNAIKNVGDCGIPHLDHPAKQLFIIKRREVQILTRKFNDTTPLSQNLRLRAAMFNNHMPWGYNALFDGYGGSSDVVNLEFLQELSQEEEAAMPDDLKETIANEVLERPANSLYPDLSDL